MNKDKIKTFPFIIVNLLLNKKNYLGNLSCFYYLFVRGRPILTTDCRHRGAMPVRRHRVVGIGRRTLFGGTRQTICARRV